MEQENQVITLLENIGLTKTEANLYLQLVKQGAVSGYRLAKTARVYKANTYLALESLVNKGLVLKKEINSKLLFDAVSPESIVKNLDLQKEKLQSLIPFIQRDFRQDLEEVSVFTGLDSFFQILYSLLEQKETLYAYDLPSYVPEIVKIHIMKFHHERARKKISMYHIYDYDAKERIALLNKMKHTYAKQGFKDRLSLTSTIVCGNVSLIINWKKEIKTVRIVDKDVADTNRKQFDVLWNQK